MAWGTEFTADVYLSHLLFRTKDQLLEQIEEAEGNISLIKEKLLMYASSTPKDIYLSEETEEESPTDEDLLPTIHEMINELFDWLREEMFLLSKLYLFMETLENNPDKDISEYFPKSEI
jgi:hypothetical protein